MTPCFNELYLVKQPKTSLSSFPQEKYGSRWRRNALSQLQLRSGNPMRAHSLSLASAVEPHEGWLRKMIFTPGSPVTRRTVCKTMTSLCSGNVARIHWLLAMLVQAIPDVRLDGGEHAAEYVALFTDFIKVRAFTFFLGITAHGFVIRALNFVRHLMKKVELTQTPLKISKLC